jgi:16S rRNA (uracil1498-N3)-methyltransferase
MQGDVLCITGPAFHHLVHVRRIALGACMRVALPDGSERDALVTEITTDALRARLSPLREVDTPICFPPLCRITLYQAVLKGEKMDWVVQKACELGAAMLIPVFARRSVPRLEGTRASERTARWQRIADAAAAQCERPVLMRVEAPYPLADALDSLPQPTLLLHERDGQSLSAVRAALGPTAQLGLLVGPEGGWDPIEAEVLVAAGTIPVRLGPRILRAETAATVALALAQSLWGDLS